MKLPIVEMFVTLQGEGQRSGVPSLFIRLGGCSLSCPGFGYRVEKNGQIYLGCDSIHAVHPDFSDDWKFYDSHLEILDAISRLNQNYEDVVITGGEPMIHHKNKIFKGLIESLSIEKEIYIETNGTVPIDFDKYPIYKKLHMTISPKMKISAEPESKRIKLNVLQEYISSAKDAVLKIVMGKYDIANPYEIQQFIKKLKTKIPIYIMPLGATKEELEEVSPLVWNFAVAHGYRFSDRMHVRLFSDKTGV